MLKWVEILKFDESSDEMEAFPIPLDGMSLVTLRDKIEEYLDDYRDNDNSGKVKDLRFERHYDHRGHCSNCAEDRYWWTLEAEVEDES